MQQIHHFVIFKSSPLEKIFDGSMTFPDAREFMDLNACSGRPIVYKVFNDSLNRWEDFKDSYVGERKVYDKLHNLFILDPDYHEMKKLESQLFHLWLLSDEGFRVFIQSFSSEALAISCRDFLNFNSVEGFYKGIYYVVPSDISF